MAMRVKLLAAFIGLLAATSITDARFPRGAAPGVSAFNNGKYQANLNFTGFGGYYPFINELKDTSGGWTYGDNSGYPSPSELDANGYPVPGANMFAHSGVFVRQRIPSSVDGGQVRVLRATGKGTVGINTSNAAVVTASASSITTGSTTTVNFSVAPTYSFRAGMEVPIGTVTGITATNGGGGNITSGGTTGAFTVCAAGLTSTSFRLCLNDGTTLLTTSGTGSGTPVISYGRYAVGVTTNGRIIIGWTGSPPTIDITISATDASTPISNMALMRPGHEAAWDACTLPGNACFNPDFIALMASAPPAVLRDLNVTAQSNNYETQYGWATRKPTNYYSYGAHYAPSALYGGATTSTAGTNDYAMTFGSGGPTHGQQIIFKFDATSVTVANGGSPTQITWTSHGLVVGDPFVLYLSSSSGSLPTTSTPTGSLAAAPTVYYVKSVVNANTITFTNSLGGTAIVTSSASSGVLAHKTVVNTTNATATASSTTLHWPGHLLSVNDPVGCNSCVAPTTSGGKYFVKTIVGPDDVTISATPGGTAITFTSSGTFGGIVREPTFNVNGTGAVPLRGLELTALTTNGRSNAPMYANSGYVQQYGILTYDSVVGVWSKAGADQSIGSAYLINFWPPEIFLELCKAIGAHPWFVGHMYAMDPLSDFYIGGGGEQGLLAYVAANKASWQVPIFEAPCNEYWNSNFPCTSFGQNHGFVYKATAGWTGDPFENYAGKVASVVGQATAAAFGTHLDSTVYKVVVGLQTGSFYSANAPTTVAPRFTAADYVAQSTAPQSGFAKDAASKWLTHAASANYFYPSLYGNATLTNTLGTAYAAGRIHSGTIDATGAGTGAAGVILTVNSVDAGTLDVGSTLLAPGLPAGVTITKMSPTAGCGGTCSGTGGAGTYEVSGSYLVGNSSAPGPINFIPAASDPNAIKSFIDTSIYGASFTATITGTSMVTTSVTGTIVPNNLSSNGVAFLYDASGNNPNLIQIVSQASGTTGGAGTYTLSASNTGGPATYKSSDVFTIAGNKVLFSKIRAMTQGYCNGDGGCVAPTSYALGNVGYEGGYSPDISGSFNTASNQMFAQGKFVTSTPNSANGLEGYVTTNCTNFTGAGGQYCSLFQISGTGPSEDDWSALPDIYVPNGSSYFNGYKNLP